MNLERGEPATTPLRVLHIITHLALGGATKNVLALCRLSDPAAVEPAVLCGATSAHEEALDGTEDSRGVSLHTLPSLRRPIHPLADSRAYRDLIGWLREGRWDVVHTHGSKAGVLGRLAAAKAGVPVIVHTVHGWGHHERQRRAVRKLYVAMERRAARVTDRIIVVADASRDQGLADHIGTTGQYVTIRGGIDIRRYRDVVVDRRALRRSLEIPYDAPVVGTVSRLADQKAPGDFVTMAAHIHVRHPEAHFIFIGGGPLQEKIEAQVRAAGLGGVVHLLGYRDDIPQLLRAFDVFVLNSLWEGLPAVFAQAMCARLPLVATNVGGAAEAIREGENGLLVRPSDPVGQAEAVMRLLEDASLRQRMGQRGLEMVDPLFCERDMVRRVEALYWECAQARGMVPPSSLPLNRSSEPDLAQKAVLL